MMDLDSLLVTHNSLRNPDKINELLKLDNIDNILVNHKIPIMRIPQMRFFREVNLYFIRDCHHACVASLHHRLTNDKPLTLNEDEYTIEDYTFTDIWTANPEVGWVTPFNPITHVRKSNFYQYKTKVMQYLKEFPETDYNTLIKECFDEYAEPREVLTVKDLYLKHIGAINEETRNLVGVNAH